MSDGWEDITSADGWEDLPSSEQKKVEGQLSKIADIAGGLLETGTTGVVNAFGGLGASAFGSIKGALSDDSTASQGMEEAQKAYADSTFAKLMAPQTETGHAIEEFFTKGVEGWKEDAAKLAELPPDSKAPEWAKAARRAYFAALSTAPEAMMLTPLVKGARPAPAETPKPKKGLDADAMFKEEPKQPAPEVTADRPTMPVTPEGQGIVNPMDAVFKAEAERQAALLEHVRPVEGRNLSDPFGQMKQQLNVDQQLPPLENPAISRIVDDLQNPPMNAEAINRFDAAQAVLDARQKALELEVARKGGLDFNAAERARQEAAPTGFAEHQRALIGDRAMDATVEGLMTPAERAQRQVSREGVPTQGEGTLFVDPAGQVIRHRPDDMAMLALERQKEAARNNLENNIATKRGQPMEPLTMDSLRASNEGPQATPADIINTNLREHMAQAAAMEHPLVRKAMERVTKQEELIVKINELMNEGRATRNQLKRAEQDLANFEQSAQRTIQNVTRAKKDGKRAIPFNFKRQGGAVNPDVFKEGFQKLKQLADGTWLRAHNEGGEFRVEAIKDGHRIGEVLFNSEFRNRRVSDEKNLTSWGTKVLPEYQGKGLATEMYKFASELGNDIQPSMSRSPDGYKMWDGFERRGLTNSDGVIKSPGNKQAGFLSFNDIVKAFPAFANSKVKKPLYRGTRTDYPYPERVRETGALGRGVYLTESPSFASTFAGSGDGSNVRAAYVNLQNPLILDQKKRDVIRQMHFTMDREQAQKYTDSLMKKGHDGVIVMLDGEVKEAVIFDPDNVKNAFSIDTPSERIKSPGNSQTGAIFVNPEQKKTLESVDAIKRILGPIAPSQWTKEQVIEIAKKEKDVDQNAIQKLSNHLTKGGLYQSLKTDNSLVRFANEKVLQADRLSRADIEQALHDRDFGLGPAFRALSKDEFTQVWKAINMADFTKTELTPERLRQFGATDKQIKAISTHRQVMDKAFEMLNKAREDAGLPPVDKRVAYAAMRATGDYRRLVYKGDKIVGMVGSDFRSRANNLAKQLEEKGYTVGEERYVGGVPRERGSAQQALMQSLEFLAENDPDVKKLMETVGEVMTQEAYNMLNMKVHTEAKKGIFGMEGRKKVDGVDWASDFRNAKEGLTAQMQYAEMAMKWGPMSKAAKDIREILTDKDINQPMAKRWVEGYLQNALGFNPSSAGRYAERWAAELMGSTGVGYSNIRQLMSGSRKVVNTVLLGLNPMFWQTNVVQPMVAMPGMKQYLITKGLRPDFDFGTGYSYITRGGNTAVKINAGLKLSELENAAQIYAKKNHVYGSDLVEHSNRARKDFPFYAERVGNFVTGSIESATRRTMFYSFVHMLNDNGMSVKNGLFEAAHNLTDMTMNNYSAVERPNLYNALGPVGDTAANLASFKHNELSRVALYARQLKEEKSARPLLAQLATGVAFSGILGTLAFEEADWLYKQITSMMGKPDSLALRVIKMSEDNPIIGNKYALSHGGFSFLGLDMTKRLGLSNLTPDNLGEALFPGGSKLVEMGSSAIDLAKSPTETNAKQAARAFSPGVATGMMDRAWFSKQTSQGELASNRNTLEGQVIRNKHDKIWKSLGGTGVNESVQKAKLYETDWMKQAYAEKRKPWLTKAHEELYATGRVDPATVKGYLDAEGDIKTLAADISRTLKKQNVPAKDRALLQHAMSQSITSLRHAQRLQETFGE